MLWGGSSAGQRGPQGPWGPPQPGWAEVMRQRRAELAPFAGEKHADRRAPAPCSSHQGAVSPSRALASNTRRVLDQRRVWGRGRACAARQARDARNVCVWVVLANKSELAPDHGIGGGARGLLCGAASRCGGHSGVHYYGPNAVLGSLRPLRVPEWVVTSRDRQSAQRGKRAGSAPPPPPTHTATPRLAPAPPPHVSSYHGALRQARAPAAARSRRRRRRTWLQGRWCCGVCGACVRLAAGLGAAAAAGSELGLLSVAGSWGSRQCSSRSVPGCWRRKGIHVGAPMELPGGALWCGVVRCGAVWCGVSRVCWGGAGYRGKSGAAGGGAHGGW
jgi:hypothetical protein